MEDCPALGEQIRDLLRKETIDDGTGHHGQVTTQYLREALALGSYFKQGVVGAGNVHPDHNEIALYLLLSAFAELERVHAHVMKTLIERRKLEPLEPLVLTATPASDELIRRSALQRLANGLDIPPDLIQTFGLGERVVDSTATDVYGDDDEQDRLAEDELIHDAQIEGEN